MGGLSNPAVQIGEVISGGTPGSVLFVGAAGDVQQDNANLFWDNVNLTLGVGTSAPAGKIHVAMPDGSGNTTTWGPNYAVFGQAGPDGGAVGISYDSVNNAGNISALAPGIAWKNLNIWFANAVSFYSGGSDKNVVITGTVGATRYLTLTGSNGGNPTIGTSAGSLSISSALQLSALGAFAAGDKYLIVDATGNVHVSALGPAS